jgi:hypothetical protein
MCDQPYEEDINILIIIEKGLTHTFETAPFLKHTGI